MFKKLSQLAYNSPGGGREKEKKENTERKMVSFTHRSFYTEICGCICVREGTKG